AHRGRLPPQLFPRPLTSSGLDFRANHRHNRPERRKERSEESMKPMASVRGLCGLSLTLVALAAPSASGQANPDRNAYFGDEHIHTSWSVDAWLMGNRLTGPDDALKYAQGQTIKHPMGYDIKIDTALGLDGRDRPLGIRRCHQGSEHAGISPQQAARGTASHSQGPE